MRTTTKVYFCKEEELFNYDTGDYDTTTLYKKPVYVDMTDTGTERQMLLYGTIKKHAKTIRLNDNVKKKFDYIEYDGYKWQITHEHKLLKGKVSYDMVRADESKN